MRGPELRPALARCGEPARASASQLATAEDGREIAIRPETTEAGGRARCGGAGQAAGLPVARIVLLASVTAAVLGAGVVYAVTRQPALGPGRGAARPQSVRGAAAPPGPLRVVSVSPAGGARGVDGAGPVRVTFSVPLAQDSPLP